MLGSARIHPGLMSHSGRRIILFTAGMCQRANGYVGEVRRPRANRLRLLCKVSDSVVPSLWSRSGWA